jgi:hypothetical protein
MEASQHSLLAACFTLHSINVTLAIVPERGAGLWIYTKIHEPRNFGFSGRLDLLTCIREIPSSNLGPEHQPSWFLRVSLADCQDIHLKCVTAPYFFIAECNHRFITL